VTNPFNNALIPVWISEYVLAGYGTGAIMAVLVEMIVILNLHNILIFLLLILLEMPIMERKPTPLKKLFYRIATF